MPARAIHTNTHEQLLKRYHLFSIAIGLQRKVNVLKCFLDNCDRIWQFRLRIDAHVSDFGSDFLLSRVLLVLSFLVGYLQLALIQNLQVNVFE